MKIRFKGKSSEYEIEKSRFCVRAFVIKDKIKNRDEVDFITPNVEILEFSDENFSFDEIFNFLESPSDENTIIVDEFFEENLKEQNSHTQRSDLRQNEAAEKIENDEKFQEESEEQKNEEQTEKFKFSLVKSFSRLFHQNLFIKKIEEFQIDEILEVSNEQKIWFLKNLESDGQELSFVKLEILNYDANQDSISFNLELFPSGASYKYGIYGNVLRIILIGKMQNSELFAFLRSFVYKSKDKALGERIFTLSFNQNAFYRLRVKFIT